MERLDRRESKWPIIEHFLQCTIDSAMPSTHKQYFGRTDSHLKETSAFNSLIHTMLCGLRNKMHTTDDMLVQSQNV